MEILCRRAVAVTSSLTVIDKPTVSYVVVSLREPLEKNEEYSSSRWESECCLKNLHFFATKTHVNWGKGIVIETVNCHFALNFYLHCQIRISRIQRINSHTVQYCTQGNIIALTIQQKMNTMDHLMKNWSKSVCVVDWFYIASLDYYSQIIFYKT